MRCELPDEWGQDRGVIFVNSKPVRVYKMFQHSDTTDYPLIRQDIGPHYALSEPIKKEQIFIRLADAGVDRWESIYLSPDGHICLSMVRLTDMTSYVDDLSSQD